MYRQHIKIFRGISNQIDFQVRDLDRKPYALMNRRLYVVIKDQITQQVMIGKHAHVDDDRHGRYSLRLEPGEIDTWPVGKYTFSVIMTDCEDRDQLLYTDMDQRTVGEIDLSEQPLAVLRPSIQILPKDFYTVLQGSIQRKDTGKFPASNTVSSASGLHTIGIWSNNWSGTVKIQGSLEDNPRNDLDWFDVETIVNDPLDELIYTNVFGRYQWLRFVQLPLDTNQGTIDKIVYRF
jgi:hypothetical protein